MRTGNPMDGAYFFLLFAPFVLSIWAGHLLRKKIVDHLLLDCSWNQIFPAMVGVSVQILIIIAGALAGSLLVRLI